MNLLRRLTRGPVVRKALTGGSITQGLWALSLTMILTVQAGTAQAGPIPFTTYTDKAAFLSAVSGAATDNFNNLPLNTTVSSPLNRAVGSYQYTATAENGGFYPAGSAGDVWLSTNTPTDPMDFAVTAGTPTAMGGFFFDSNFDGDLAPGTINVSINGGQFLQTTFTNSATNFFGWVSDDGTPITSFQVVATQPVGGEIFPTVNDLVFAQAVPEPSTYCMALAGIACGGFSMWRRRKRA